MQPGHLLVRESQFNNVVISQGDMLKLSGALFVCTIYLFAFSEIVWLTWIPLACAIFIVWILSKHQAFYMPRIYLMPYAFFAFTLTSTLWAAYPDDSFLYAFRILVVIVSAQAIGIALLNGASIKALLNGILLGACISAVFAIPEVMSGGIGERASGLQNNANALAWNLYIPAFVLFLFPKYCSRLHWLIAACLVIFAVVVSGSQKSIIALAFLIILAFMRLLSLRRNVFRTTILVLIALIAVTALSGIVSLDNLTQEITATSRVRDSLSGHGDSSVQKREALIKMGLQKWKKSPVWGYGIAQFSHFEEMDRYYAHNNYVELLVGCGIIGTALFYAFHILLLMKTLKIFRRNWMTAYPCLIIILLLLMIDNGIVNYYSKSYWLLLVLLANHIYTL